MKLIKKLKEKFAFSMKKNKGKPKKKKTKKSVTKSKPKKSKNKNKRGKIKNQLIALVLILTLIPISTIAFVNYYYQTKNVKENMENSNLALAKSLSNEVDTYINTFFNVLDTLAATHDFRNMERYELIRSLNLTVTKIDQIKVLYVFDKNGQEVASTRNRSDKLNVSSEDWFNKALEGQKTISNSFIDDVTKLPGVIIATPMENILGEKIGVIAAKIGLNEISELVSENKVGKTGVSYIVDKTGIVIGHPNFKEKVMERYNAKEKGLEGVLQSLKGETSVSTYNNENGTSVIGAYTQVPSTGWGVIIEQNTSEVKEAQIKNLYRNIGIVAIVIVLVIIVTSIASRVFTKTVRDLAKAANTIKTGDLTVRVEEKAKNEIGELQKAFNQMIDALYMIIFNLKDAITDIKDSSKYLTESANLTVQSSEEISGIVEEVANGTEMQLENVEEATNMVDMMSGRVKSVEEGTKGILKATNEAANIVKESSKDIDNTKEIMYSIEKTVKKSADQISTLSEHVDEIGKIVSFIEEISQQTNLLALNAAIEAARAGEHGKGFTVVAEEVRQLAEQTSNASSDIVNIVNKIQDEMKLVTKSMNTGIDEVNKGSQIIGSTTESFNRILTETDQVVETVEKFTTIVDELLEEMSRIEKAISQVGAVSQQTASGIQTILASTEEQQSAVNQINEYAVRLNEMASQLNSLIVGFKIE
ncbi:methyl-accepting chemotaxis protein [Thermohalobacter berrensis]|uniref:Chemotaxis protein n=1 Tax=Thermohalobacter berrensis TaxID=99594 RepID=A0A419T4H3_9FIRM|nr:methyl-accepting chemotaxis protein [Thermohalobacter berrensis]RKD32345.1 hypothetical protein BET03_03290 [Thermohalobacter berrensis]